MPSIFNERKAKTMSEIKQKKAQALEEYLVTNKKTFP